MSIAAAWVVLLAAVATLGVPCQELGAQRIEEEMFPDGIDPPPMVSADLGHPSGIDVQVADSSGPRSTFGQRLALSYVVGSLGLVLGLASGDEVSLVGGAIGAAAGVALATRDREGVNLPGILLGTVLGALPAFADSGGILGVVTIVTVPFGAALGSEMGR